MLQEKKVLFVTGYCESWPPKGWGATSVICYELSRALEKRGVKTMVVAEKTFDKTIEAIRWFNPSIVHFEYDDYAIGCILLKELFPNLRCAATSHFAYLCSPEMLKKENYYYEITFKNFIRAIKAGIEFYPCSEQVRQTYEILGDVDLSKSPILPNGGSDTIQFSESAKYPDKAICLARIEKRKGQGRLCFQKNVDFYGPYSSQEDLDLLGNQNKEKFYKGEMTREMINTNLTEYGALVLLSKAEAAPFVVPEALMAGLGLVITDVCAVNLDLSKPWICVLSQQEADDPQIVRKAISETLVEAAELGVRKEIREYALKNHSWDAAADRYLKCVLDQYRV